MSDPETSLRDRPVRRRCKIAWRLLVALGLSMALHGTVLRYIDDGRRTPGASEPEKIIDVALVTVPEPPPPPPPPPPAAVPKPAASSPPVPRRPTPRPKPRPRPAAIATTAAPVVAPVAPPGVPETPVPEYPVVADDAVDPADPPATPPPVPPPALPEALGGADVPAAVDAPTTEPQPQPAGCTPTQGPLLFGQPLPEPPPPGRWMYDIYFGEYAENRLVAELEITLQRDNDAYQLSSAGRARGLTALLYSGELRQVSVGRFGANGLEPLRFSEQRGKREERSWQADPAQCEVVFGGQARAASRPGQQDRLSVLVQLGMLARSHPDRFAQGSQVVTDEVSLGAIDQVRYLSHGEALLPTSQGPVRALHLERLREQGDSGPAIDIWLGYDVGMLPVRIRVTESNGRVLDQLLRSGG